jgi:uncharacterized protein (TIGR02453 family)
MPFTKKALDFLKGIKKNNNKQWFEAHRQEYEAELREPMRELIGEMSVRFKGFAPEIMGDPKRSMFRINRDIRFSKDKSPYKTNAACWFFHKSAGSRVGSEADEGSAGFYFHLEPSRSMIGGGLWMPPRTSLGKIREAIAEKPRVFETIARGLEKRFDGLDTENMLKRMPQGYAETHPAAKWLKYQSFVSGRVIPDSKVTGSRLPVVLEQKFTALLPLVRFLNGAIGLSR